MKNAFLFEGLGFPVIIKNPKFKEIKGYKVLDINMNKFKKDIFKILLLKPVPLSSAEIKFLRKYLNMTQENIAIMIKTKQSSIAQWEKNDLKATGMSFHTEMYFRSKLAEKINSVFKVKIINKEFNHKASAKEPIVYTNKKAA